jgi:hypothetical protein
MSDSRLETLIEKIDKLLESIENRNYSTDKKLKYNLILKALKEIAQDNLK